MRLIAPDSGELAELETVSSRYDPEPVQTNVAYVDFGAQARQKQMEVIESARDHVAQYGSIDELADAINSEAPISDNLFKNWKRLSDDLCHNRSYCNMLGLDYANLPKKDELTLELFAMYIVKQDPNFILPRL